MSDKAPVMVELGRVVVPGVYPTWCTMIFFYRLQYSDKTKFSAKRVSIRRYKFVQGEWKKMSGINLNSKEEVVTVFRSLLEQYPDLAVDLP